MVADERKWFPVGELTSATDQMTSGYVTDRSSATAAAINAIVDGKVAALRTELTKPAPRPIAVFIGASNVVPGTWPEALSAWFGWDCRNFAVGGAGFYHGDVNTNSFLKQVRTAVADKTFDHTQVKFVFVAGGGNDARSADKYYTVYPEALQVIRELQAEFRNARVITIPGLWGNSPATDAILQVSKNIRDAALAQGAETIWHAWTWLLGRADWMADSVHPNGEGYRQFTNYVRQYVLGGGVTSLEYDWYRIVAPSGLSTDGVDSYPPLSVSCTGGVAYLRGTMQSFGATPTWQVWAILPAMFRPASNVTGFATTKGNSENVRVAVGVDGAVATPAALDAARTLFVNVSWRI